MAASSNAKRHSRKLKRRFSSDSIPLRNSSKRTLASDILAPEQVRHVNRRPYVDVSNFEEYPSPTTSGNRGRSPSPVSTIFDHSLPPTVYASLPPTPILPSRPVESPPRSVSPVAIFENDSPRRLLQPEVPFSLWDYLREELLATDFDSHQEMKWERVRNFLSMPWAMEKVPGHLFAEDKSH